MGAVVEKYLIPIFLKIWQNSFFWYLSANLSGGYSFYKTTGSFVSGGSYGPKVENIILFHIWGPLRAQGSFFFGFWGGGSPRCIIGKSPNFGNFQYLLVSFGSFWQILANFGNVLPLVAIFDNFQLINERVKESEGEIEFCTDLCTEGTKVNFRAEGAKVNSRAEGAKVNIFWTRTAYNRASSL